MVIWERELVKLKRSQRFDNRMDPVNKNTINIRFPAEIAASCNSLKSTIIGGRIRVESIKQNVSAWQEHHRSHAHVQSQAHDHHCADVMIPERYERLVTL